ncbi:MAG: ATP-dependent DNA helicase [Eubacteriales bacterium]|nr:ATP-dependent DNA helicase [Eubacteriales bacterium]
MLSMIKANFQANNSARDKSSVGGFGSTQNQDLTEVNPSDHKTSDELKSEAEKPTPQTIQISARRLAELVHREGGLAGTDYAAIEGVEGIRAQQKAVRALRAETAYAAAEFYEEYSLNCTIFGKEAALEIRGRADLLLKFPDYWQVVEFKSFRGPKLKLAREGRAEHRAQALLYTAMLAQAENFSRPSYETLLIYVSVDEDDYLLIRFTNTAAELRDFLESTARSYLNQVANVIRWQERRDASLKAARFPYAQLRSGQTELMREVLACMRDKRTLFVEAPTGIGKTMATLYPSLKALAAGYIKRVFYATAMISTRDQAQTALQHLRENSLCLVRSIYLTAKEKICLQPNYYCEQRICPFAVNYYKNLPDALAELLNYENLDQTVIQAVADKHQLCPFELSLDAALYCDVIIGDYNHVFDPRIRLKRFFDDEEEAPIGILVDEAHNLAARGRQMFSATLTLSGLLKLRTLWQKEEYLPFTQAYQALKASLEAFIAIFESIERIFSQAEEPDIKTKLPRLGNSLCQSSLTEDWVLAGDFLALRKKPDRLEASLARLIRDLRQFFDEQWDFPGRQEFLQTFFDLLHFQRILSEYYNQAYITGARRLGDDCYLSLLCLDAAAFLSRSYYDKHPLVFFSATLNPQVYYEKLLYSKATVDPPERLRLPSPFPRENQLLLVESSLSLRYQDRAASLNAVRETIFRACAEKTGNYLIFLPSHAYLKQLVKNIQAYGRPEKTRIIAQRPGFNSQAKTAFLDSFKSYGEETLIGLAVLGGMFSEGIDLQGEQLSGVICVGVGLPGISPERQLLAEYSDSSLGSGFLFAYVFPAFQRIRQAAGRLIRSETDKGFVLLIDKRWGQEPYRGLFSAEKRPHFLEGPEDLTLCLQDFWQQNEN